MWRATAVLLLGACEALVVAASAHAQQGVHTGVLPPCVPPLVAPADDAPAPDLGEVLRAVGPAQLAPKPRGPRPAAGSATESEALRRYVRAQLRRQSGQPRRATEDLDAALRLDPASAALHRARADAAAEGGDIARAVAEWEAVLALAPRDAEAALAVGMAALETGQANRAVSILGPVWARAAGGERPDERPGERGDHAARVNGTGLNATGQFTLGATLARALLQVGSTAAALAPAQSALAIDPARIAAERGDGLDAAVRERAALARDAGEAALQAGQWAVASDLLADATADVSEPRAQALAVVAAALAGRTNRVRAVLDQVLGELLDSGAAPNPTQVLIAEWALDTLGGDAACAARVDAAMTRSPGSGSIARLLAAAAPERAAATLDEALAQGAVDRATLHAAFSAHELAGAVSLALRTVRVDPALIRTAARELARSARSMHALLAALDATNDSPEREALRAALAAYHHSPGAAWQVAETARERWPDEPSVFFALMDAATASGDPSLVERARVDAPELLASDAHWHAAIARAALATGLTELASASLARCESLDPGSDLPVRLRAAAAGNAPAWSPRGRAEQAISRGDLREAASALTEVRALDPEDDIALRMLLRVLARTLGAEGTHAWAEAEAARVPNDPLVWEALALHAINTGRAPAALALLEGRLVADPDSTVALPARETLLRAAGMADAALVAARTRTAALPPGPRRALEQASVEAQAGDAGAATDALRMFAESAYLPPMGMRVAALEVLSRLPVSAVRAEIMRRIARDAIIADDAAPLEFYAFEVLSVASDPAIAPADRVEFAGMIGDEAAAVPLHRAAEAHAHWHAACDFLATQGYAAEAAEFTRARLNDAADLDATWSMMLARAALAADALAGAGARVDAALTLLGSLHALGIEPFGHSSYPAAAYTELASIFTLAGDPAGAERVLEAAIAKDPDDPIAQNNLAFARAARGDVGDRTLHMATRALAARPAEATHMDTLGWVRYLRGEIADDGAEPGALTLLRRAAAHPSGSASGEIPLHLGDALWRSGDHDRARHAWATAFQRAMVLDREQTIALYREAFRRRTGLSAVDPARYYDDHDGRVAAEARARLDAIDAGDEPQLAPTLAPAPAAQGTARSPGTAP